MKININPKKELFKWGPIDGKLIYVDFFNIAFTLYQKKYYPWPDVMGYFHNEKMTFILDHKDLIKNGIINLKKYILPNKNFTKAYKNWGKILKKLLNYQKNIDAKYLNKLTNEELLITFKEWSKLYFDFWLIGLLPEISNYGGEDLLKQLLKNKVNNNNDFIILFERLMAPEKLSFYQQAELDLLRLKQYENKKIFNNKLKQYQQKYFHILNSYHHTKTLDIEYFIKELAKYTKRGAKNKIKEIKFLVKTTRQEKESLIKKYNLNRKINKIATRLSFCIWWQDLRKFYIFRANHYIDLFLTEFSKRYKINFNHLHYYNYYELIALLQNNSKINKSELKKRLNHLLFLHSKKKNSLEYFSGSIVKKNIQPYIDVTINKNIKTIKGLVVSRGKLIKAKVKILTSPKKIDKIKKGEILVAAMTSPDYITAMKKSSAIITDAGGLTCHAAIVSRELGIPCIVGTKIATKVLKDGDLVEINTNKGIIKKIK